MIQSLSSENGVDVFTKTSSGFLVYEWSRSPKLEEFEYRVVSENVGSNFCMTTSASLIHLYYIDKEGNLVHRRIDQNKPQSEFRLVIAHDFEQSVDPICCQRQQADFVYAVNKNNQFVQISLAPKPNPQSTITPLSTKTPAKPKILSKQSKQKVLFYEQDGKIHTLCLTNQKNRTKKVIDSLNVKEGESFQVFEIKGVTHLFFVNHQNYICHCTLNQETTSAEKVDRISEREKMTETDIAGAYQFETFLLAFVSGPQQISLCSFSKGWTRQKISLQSEVGSRLCFNRFNDQSCLMFLDKKDIMYRYKVQMKEGKTQLKEAPGKPCLLWPEVQDKVKPIGQKGYYADCFHYQEKDLVVKRFRLTQHAFYVNHQINILKSLSEIGLNSFRHALYENGILMGFTLPFYKGRVYDDLLTDSQSIFHKSPIARVKLVLKLWDFVRDIQKIKLAHADMHCSNVLIDLGQKQQDVLYPDFEVNLIDFGNAFYMTEGKQVSQELADFDANIPPEVLFSRATDYDPFGLNAYQFARCALMFLLKQKMEQCESIHYAPFKEINSLKEMEEYPPQLSKAIEQLVHYNIERRNKVLNQDHSHLELATRQIYQLKVKEAQNKKQP